MGSVTDLIHQFRQGDEKAFAQLFLTYYPGQVTRMKRRLRCASPSLSDPEDLANSVFHKLWAGDGPRTSLG